MSRAPLLSSPLLLGFDEIERLIDRVGKSGSDGYPPYNIERLSDGPSNGVADGGGGEPSRNAADHLGGCRFLA